MHFRRLLNVHFVRLALWSVTVCFSKTPCIIFSSCFSYSLTYLLTYLLTFQAIDYTGTEKQTHNNQEKIYTRSTKTNKKDKLATVFPILFLWGWLWTQIGVIADRHRRGPTKRHGPIARSPVCAISSVDRWCATLPWTWQVCGVYQLRDLVLSVYCVQLGRMFHWLAAGLCVQRLTDTPRDPNYAGHNRLVTALSVHRWHSNTHYDPGVLIPEFKGLSPFREDTGKPSMPVREFNFIACLLFWSSWNPLDLELNPGRWELSARQPSRHCAL